MSPGNSPTRVSVSQRRQRRQALSKSLGEVEGAPTTITLKSLSQRTLKPARKVYDFEGLTMIRSHCQALSRFWHTSSVEQAVCKATGRVRSARIDLPCQFGTLQRFVPSVFKPQNL